MTMSSEILLERIYNALGGDTAVEAGGIGAGAVISVSQLNFNPVGAHSDGATISSATTLTAPTGATKIMMQTLTQNVRFTLDNTAPTTSRGFQLKAGDPPVILPIGASTTVRVIQEAATADLQYQWGE